MYLYVSPNTSCACLDAGLHGSICRRPSARLGSYLASFLLSLEIQVMNFFYRKVAVWTTQRENHRTDTVFEDMLIAKLAVFQA